MEERGIPLTSPRDDSKDFRLDGKGPGEGNALLLAAAQLMHGSSFIALHANRGEGFGDTLR